MKPKLYLVLKVSEFAKSLTSASGIAIQFSEGPKYFCPVFTNRKEAVKWAGDSSLVREVTRVEAK